MSMTMITTAPDPEVAEKATRRRFTGDYKLRIVQAADRCTQPGELGAMLRREGLYSSHLTAWRKQVRDGTLRALAPKKRGPKKKRDPRDAEMANLRRENARLKKKLEHYEIAHEAQKKLAELWDVTLTGEATEETDESS
jgi:transposase-like protein